MSTRLADLTQYREWQVAYPGGRFSKDGSMYYLPDDFVGDRINPPKPISSELLESVQVFNAPEITIGPVPHPDSDKCPDNCDSKTIHFLYRMNRNAGYHSGGNTGAALTATVPTTGPNCNFTDNTIKSYPSPALSDLVDRLMAPREYTEEQSRAAILTAINDYCFLTNTEQLLFQESLQLFPKSEPDPMTLERAVAVLNERNYLERVWVLSDIKTICADGAISVPPKATEYFSKHATIAIAEKLEHEAK